MARKEQGMTDLITLPRATVQQALEALENSSPDQYPEDAGVFYDAKDALKAALEQPEPCQYPDCVDNGPEGKCTRWLLAECSKSEDYKPHRPAEPTRAQKMRDAGYTRRPTLREMAEPEQEQEPVAFDALVAISLLTHLGGEVADYEDVVEAVRRLHALNGELGAALRRLISYCNNLENRLMEADGEHPAMQEAKEAWAKVEGEV
jgi:NTP pyrophosphatase (non-canonical NTP hydrolase)